MTIGWIFHLLSARGFVLRTYTVRDAYLILELWVYSIPWTTGAYSSKYIRSISLLRNHQSVNIRS